MPGMMGEDEMTFATCKWIIAPPNCKYMFQCTRGDIESFFMLFFDNFSSLLGILGAMVGTPLIANDFDFANYFPYFQAYRDMVFRRVCPGIGCALIFGNFWYWWMAGRLSRKENNRMDVTALPYGINTPAGFITVFAVMLPVAFKYSPKINTALGNDILSPEDYAWACFSAGCCANLCGGLFEVLGIFLGNVVRKMFPRAALFGPICGVGFVWLGFNPLIDCMREPLIGLVPLFLCFTGFFANGGKGIYPAYMPTAVLIAGYSSITWWCGLARWDTDSRVDNNGDLNEVSKMGAMVSYASEQYLGKNQWSPFAVLSGFSEVTARMIAIQFPIALASFLETIENVEAAHLEGDSYNVYEAMLADGLGTMFGACCGAVMPTTVYIGHKRHKAVGATAMYSFVNGIVYFIFMMSGLTGVLFYCIDQVGVGVILIAVGLMIVQQAMEHAVSRHYPALLIGVMFVVADLVYFDMFDYTATIKTRSLGRMQGLANMAPGGGILCSLMVPAILCDLTDSRYGRAAIYCFLSAGFSLFGLMHGNNYVFADGSEMHVHKSLMGGGDLGEVMFAGEAYPTACNPGPACNYPFVVAPPNTTAGYQPYTYHINHFEDMSVGYRVPTVRSTSFNEGWRFCISYVIVGFLCLIHMGIQMTICKGKEMWTPVMDNGVAHPPSSGKKGETSATA